MEVTELGIVTPLFRLPHLLKAEEPMLVTELGIDTPVMELSMKADAPMAVTVYVIPLPSVTCSGMATESRELILVLTPVTDTVIGAVAEVMVYFNVIPVGHAASKL
jgi:hypothetical protein